MTAPTTLTKPHAKRLNVDDFLTLDRAGALDGYSKSELIDGTIYVVHAQHSAHMMVKVRLLRRLADACDTLPGRLEAWSEGSVRTTSEGLPEPDIFITDLTPTAEPSATVDGATVVLIVEVADTSLRFDLGKKARHYAAAGIPEYWVVDLPNALIHRHWSPNASAFDRSDKVRFGEVAESATIPGLSVDTSGLL